MTQKNCEACIDLLSDYIDGALSNDDKTAVEEHLTECEACRHEYEQLKQTVSLLSDTKYNPDGAVYDAVMKCLREENPRAVKKKHGFMFMPGSACLGMLTAAAAVALVIFLGRGAIFDNDIIIRSPKRASDAAADSSPKACESDDGESCGGEYSDDGAVMYSLTAGDEDSGEETSAEDGSAYMDERSPENNVSSSAPNLFSNAMTSSYDPVAVYTEQYAPSYAGYVSAVAIVRGADWSAQNIVDYIDMIEYSDAAAYISLYDSDSLTAVKNGYASCEIYTSETDSGDAGYLLIIVMKIGG
ncbi:MAG: zf-HC2 domain-containing protein [Eubacteriales bacterium]